MSIVIEILKIIWRHLSLSELTPYLIQLVLTHLGSETSICKEIILSIISVCLFLIPNKFKFKTRITKKDNEKQLYRPNNDNE